MDFNNNRGDFNNNRGGAGFQRQVYKGEWQCAKCGAAITELPFQPDEARLDKLLCRNCHQERVRSFRR
jgi:CxxC-x17-CxxC domain-containing protein